PPQKTREIQNHIYDSTRWNTFQFHDNDIIVATYGKSGTTWMQQIVLQLIYNGQADLNVSELSPWIDCAFGQSRNQTTENLQEQHRRCLKTQLPVDALVFSSKAKYIYVARDGRDIAWSRFNHFSNISESAHKMFENVKGSTYERPATNVVEFYHDWLNKDGFPNLPFWQHIRSWWNIRHQPNVLLVHFQQLKNDLPGQIQRIAKFLDIKTDDDLKWNEIVEHCTFDYMKEHSDLFVPGKMSGAGSKTFIYKGTNGRWKDLLTDGDCREYEKIAEEQLGKEAAHWLATGDMEK
ncbi:unnamed protein product, partial [Didymodactylos carnosus]